MYNRKTAIIEVVAVTGEQYVSIAKCVSRVIFVGMTTQPNLLYCTYTGTHPPKYFSCIRRKVFVSVKPCLGPPLSIVFDLCDLRFRRRILLG